MRTGIFGGTFSPIHAGHIKAAKAFLSELSLDVLYVIPDRIPPHKQITGKDDPWLRLEMVKKAFEGEEKIVVSDVELRREGKSYTVETLPEFTGKGELFMLIGTDMFLSFDRWYRFRDIFEMCTLVLMVRESRESGLRAEIDKKKALYESMGAKVCELTAEPFPISSTELRALIASGKDTGEYIPAPVLDFIKEKGLYR